MCCSRRSALSPRCSRKAHCSTPIRRSFRWKTSQRRTSSSSAAQTVRCWCACKRPASASGRRLSVACIARGQSAQGGPIEVLATLSEQAQKPALQQGSQRHRHAQAFRCGERQADILESECRRERGRLEPVCRDQAAIGRVDWSGEDGGSEQLDVGTAIDASLAHERDGLAQRLEDRKSTRLNSSHRCISYAVFCL